MLLALKVALLLPLSSSSCPKYWDLEEAIADPDLVVAFVGQKSGELALPLLGRMYWFKVSKNIRGAPLTDVIVRMPSGVRPPFYQGESSIVFLDEPLLRLPVWDSCFPGGAVARFTPSPSNTLDSAGSVPFPTLSLCTLPLSFFALILWRYRSKKRGTCHKFLA